MLEPDKQYKLALDISQGKEVLFHVDYILENKTEQNSFINTIVVGRIWLKHKGYWKHLIYEAWEIQLRNEEKPFLDIYKYK